MHGSAQEACHCAAVDPAGRGHEYLPPTSMAPPGMGMRTGDGYGEERFGNGIEGRSGRSEERRVGKECSW